MGSEEEKIEGTEVLRNGYKLFYIGPAIFCLSINPVINQQLHTNNLWVELATVQEFKIYTEAHGARWVELHGYPPEIINFLKIFNVEPYCIKRAITPDYEKFKANEKQRETYKSFGEVEKSNAY